MALTKERQEQMAAWARANPEKMREYSRRSSQRKRLEKHGLSPGDYERMLLEQGGVCKACRNEEVKVQNGRVVDLAIDHCHTTGVVRGLLCQGCNLALGHVRDDIARLRALINYLER